MLSRTLFRSDERSIGTTRYLSVGLLAVFAAVVPMLGALVTTNIYVVTVDDPVFEDQYVTSQSAVIEGVVNGDLTIFTGNLTINGEVTGSVQVMSAGTVDVTRTGRIGGAIRGAAVNVTISGEVAGDVFVTAPSIVVEERGIIGNDLMAFGGVTRIEGHIGRDVRGRMIRTVVTGDIRGDIDVATQRFEVGSSASIDGDILYRSPTDASISPDAELAGTVTRLPTQSNFVYGLILALANIVGVLAFLVAGIVILLVARGTGTRATGAMITNPVRSLLYGIVAVIVTPVLIVLLGVSLIGLPIAGMLAMLLVVAVVVGPVPAVAALGNRIMFRRGGLLGAFVVGALLWRLGIWLIPVYGGILYVIALVWGIGAWIVGAVASRREDVLPMALLPESMVPATGVPPDWKPPYAPGHGVRAASAPSDEPAVDQPATVEVREVLVTDHVTDEPPITMDPVGADGVTEIDDEPIDKKPPEPDTALDDTETEQPPDDNWGLPSS